MAKSKAPVFESIPIPDACGKSYYTWSNAHQERQGMLAVFHAGWEAGARHQERQGTPYPDHCRQPKVCQGKGYCPLDPVCID